MTDEELARIKARTVAVTKPISEITASAHPEFIAHAREDIPSLIAEVEKLQGVLKKFLAATDGLEEDAGTRCYVKDGEWTIENGVWDTFWAAYEEAHLLLKGARE